MFSNIPMGWKLVTIDDVFEVIRGVSFPKTARSEAADELVGCLRTANVQKNIVWDDLWKIPIAYLPTQDKLVRKNDIIISTANSLTLLGKSAMVTCVPMPCTFGTFVVNLRAKTAEFKYLYYYLQSRMFLEQVAENASTTTNISNISTAKLKRLIVPLPTLEKQKRIVARIEELFSKLDNGVETLQKTKQQLAVYRQAVLKDAFCECEKWDKHCFSDLMSEVRNGYGLKPDDVGDYRILKISAVRPLRLELSESRFNKTPFPAEDTIAENDLLFTRYNGSKEYVGVCAVVPALSEMFAYPDKLIKCRPKLHSTIHSKFLAYYMSQGDARNYLRGKIKTTSGQNGIAGADIKKTVVYLPDIDTQTTVVGEIETKLSVCDSIEKTVDTALQQAEAMRQSILKQAFEGKFV